MWVMYALYAIVFIKLKNRFDAARAEQDEEKQNGKNKKTFS